MAFKALGELLDETLTLPVKDKTYTVPPPSAATGLRVQAIMQAAAVAADGGAVDEAVLKDAAERDMYRDVLGTAHAEMVADNVPWPTLKHCAVTAMVWIVQNKEAAERYWNAGGDPSRLAPNRKARRSSSAAAKSTQSRGSTSTTNTRPATGHGGKKRKPRK
ncbi:hypothetical protein OG864_29695 [Streptomyces sp. NBC_00124]|uniref:DUF7426 family protein n=1 Tax=Streptomyces sp. NBC_00124 TaxID=2975662 RepID=UPI002251355D|nr:hypothetical protein [Streptomyces sp. NBC_00124]MCX5362875.1 hypothetical protein [Streptomyces sp. NBC_00124]